MTHHGLRAVGLTKLIVALSFAGCAHAPPQELVQARKLHEQACVGPALEHDPAAIFVARKSLQRAEWEFQQHGGSEHARNLAYIALRKVEILTVRARSLENATLGGSKAATASLAVGR